jgi:hypothetical protein
MDTYWDITLYRDVMFVNHIPFVVTISCHINFRTAESIANQSTTMLMTAIHQVRAVYMKCGFHITHLLMDGQFNSLCRELSALNITLNMVANNEHVPEVERYIHTVKECVRCAYNTLPFTKLPKWLIIELIYSCVFWLNSFPANGRVSPTISP